LGKGQSERGRIRKTVQVPWGGGNKRDWNDWKSDGGNSAPMGESSPIGQKVRVRRKWMVSTSYKSPDVPSVGIPLTSLSNRGIKEFQWWVEKNGGQVKGKNRRKVDRGGRGLTEKAENPEKTGKRGRDKARKKNLNKGRGKKGKV